jgi:Tol biopolymer transport system component
MRVEVRTPLALAVIAITMSSSACSAAPGGRAESRIAFQRFHRGESLILTIRSDGTGLDLVSAPTGRSENPEFSPDGRFIAYERSFSIYVAHLDGSKRRLVARNGYEPRWSPDGKRLLFTRSGGDTDAAIVSVGKEGTSMKELTSGSIDQMPAWSPDGSSIVFVRDRQLSQLWTMNMDGSGESRLTRAPGKEDYGPEWSPDGTAILFTRHMSYGRRCFGHSEIFVVKLTSGTEVNLTDTCRRSEFDGHWSPDGTSIVFSSETSDGSEIFVMKADGTDVRQLTDGPGRNDFPRWSPDGTKIAFISGRDGNRELYLMDSDGSSETRLTRSRAMEYQQTWQASTRAGQYLAEGGQ